MLRTSSEDDESDDDYRPPDSLMEVSPEESGWLDMVGKYYEYCCIVVVQTKYTPCTCFVFEQLL